MPYDIANLEKSSHQSPEGLPLYIWQDLGTRRILTDGYNLYPETPDRKGIDPNPIAEGKEGYILLEASPVDQFFVSLKSEVRALIFNFIQANPACLLMDVIGYVEAQRDATSADLAKVLIEAMVKTGVAKGLFTVTEGTDEEGRFEILRNFIAETSLEELEELLN